jgi:predicted AAA+ superfamily ATPase
MRRAYKCSHYRTGAGAEVDLVLDGSFGRIAVEIKHTSAVGGHDLRALRDFVVAHKARLGLVINNDVTPRLYEVNLIGLPFAFL